MMSETLPINSQGDLFGDTPGNASSNMPGSSNEQIVDPRNSVNELAAILSTPVGARTVKCHANITLRDVVACLRGGVISAVFLSALFLGAARNVMLTMIAPSGTHMPTVWAALEPCLWACVATSFVLILLYSMDSRRSLTIDPFGLIINTQLYEGIETRLLVPWHWVAKIKVRPPRFKIGSAEFHLETKYGIVYTLLWDEVLTGTVAETLIAAVRTLAPQAEIDLGRVQEERASAQDSFTELWVRSLAKSVHRERTGMLTPGMALNSGKYRITGFLGAGGQGTAYLGVDESNAGAEVVLKEYVLPAHSGSDVFSASLTRIQREIELLKALDHPNIVKLLDHFIEDYRGYLVLEYVSGSQLKDRVINSGALTEDEVVAIGVQICNVLDYLHAQKPPVVHQDIAPDNLILKDNGTVKLVDFNLARRFASGSASLVVVGKQAYIPPEQFRGKATQQVTSMHLVVRCTF